MLRACLSGIVAAFTAAGLSFGQDIPQPGPEHKELQELVGTWDAVMDMNGQKSKATAVYKSVLGGMWVESDFQGKIGEFPFQGRGMDGYDITRKKYVGVWFDSLSSAPMHSEGAYEPGTKRLIMTGEFVGPDGKSQKFKNTTAMKDKDHFTFQMFMVQPGGQEELAFSVEYTRKK
jgi:hypothetical protein